VAAISQYTRALRKHRAENKSVLSQSRKDYVPAEPLLTLLNQRTYLVRANLGLVDTGDQTGNKLGVKYDQRFGTAPGTGSRLLVRIRQQNSVNYYIADRICAVLNVPTRWVYPNVEPLIEPVRGETSKGRARLTGKQPARSLQSPRRSA